MPRPGGVDLHEIFGPTQPPQGWEQRVGYLMYFVHGIGTAMAHVDVRPTTGEFRPPLREHVARERRTSNWESALRANTWPAFASDNQVKRFVGVQNITFTTAASGVLAIELFLLDHGYGGDIYTERQCYVVAQDSYITMLNHESFADICRQASAAERKPWQDCLCPLIHQSEGLLQELVSGRLVTGILARDILRIIKRYVPAFPGQVSNDFNGRTESLQRLRRAAYEAGGRNAQKLYFKKVTGAQTEYYPG